MRKGNIIIVEGEPKSVFFEIFFKVLKKYKPKNFLILICCKKRFNFQAKKFNFKKKPNLVNLNDIKKNQLKRNTINILDLPFGNFLNSSINNKLKKQYIKNCFELAFKLIKLKISKKLLNGPVNKNVFFNKKFLGVTEYISAMFNKKNTGMLIYNKKLSVCPLTTHLPIKLVSKQITRKLIINRLKMINNFFIKNFKLKPKIAVVGLNPHCESILNYNEDDEIVMPAINLAKKKGMLVSGPYAADTIFLKQNRKKYNLILGMYHDQVLTPLKTLYEYDAVNITMGLPFFRVSPDHGPNEKMVNKNLSNPTSLTQALKLLDKI
jgi:4-hydroxy-L-threonine phosphate dehydrogenase PdxA